MEFIINLTSEGDYYTIGTRYGGGQPQHFLLSKKIDIVRFVHNLKDENCINLEVFDLLYWTIYESDKLMAFYNDKTCIIYFFDLVNDDFSICDFNKEYLQNDTNGELINGYIFAHLEGFGIDQEEIKAFFDGVEY